MPLAWQAEIDSATWEGRDLVFRAVTAEGELTYLIRASRLKEAAQRTGAEALLFNLPMLRNELIELAVRRRSSTLLTLQ